MKTLILMRHSQAQRDESLPREMWGLSLDGVMAAGSFFKKPIFENVSQVWASTMRRAYDTAMILSGGVTLDSALDERAVGQTENGDFWAAQHMDPELKNPGGESFAEVRARMEHFISHLVVKMPEDDCALLVSHGAAICAYLQSFCTVEVLDPAEKTRQVSFRGQKVMSGKIEAPSAFVLEFEKDKIERVAFLL